MQKSSAAGADSVTFDLSHHVSPRRTRIWHFLVNIFKKYPKILILILKSHNSGPLQRNWLVISAFCTIFHGESRGDVRMAKIEKYEIRQSRLSG